MLVTAAAAVMGAFGVSQSTQTAMSAAPSIAVLPFSASAGFDPILAEGLSDEVRSLLARRQGLRVVGRMSSAQFRGDAADLRTAGRSLRADYLVEGKASETLQGTRVLVSLIRARDGSIVWAKPFTSRNHLQPIPAAIGSEIGSSLDLGGATPAPAARNPEAYTLYIVAKSLIRKRDHESMIAAIELLRQAVRMDPGFAPAWAQLGGAVLLSRQEDVTVDLGAGEPVRMTSRAAVQRALKLDPSLAEAHSMMGLIEHNSPIAQVHLRRALELDPGSTQTLYWWGNALFAQGDYDAAAKVLQRVVALEPLWALPVNEVIKLNLAQGDRAEALRHLQRVKAGNPEAAAEVEFYMAVAEGDYSRAVQIEFGAGELDHEIAPVLAALGFDQPAMLVYPTAPVARETFLGNPPPTPALIEHLEAEAARSRDLFFNYVILSLARDRRWQELSAAYDAGPGLIGQLKGPDPRPRDNRLMYGPHFALALNRVGREREAALLALKTLDSANYVLRNKHVPPITLVEIAGAEAIMGRRELALTHLERAFAMGWRLDSIQFLRLRENPTFATLRGNRRFERLAAIQDAHIAKERREVEELGIL